MAYGYNQHRQTKEYSYKVDQGEMFWILFNDGEISFDGKSIKGKTYDVKDMIKADYNARWNGLEKCWDLSTEGIDLLTKQIAIHWVNK